MSSPPPAVLLYDEAVSGLVQEFQSRSDSIANDEISQMSKLVNNAFLAQRNFLWSAAGQVKPSNEMLQPMLSSISKEIEAIQLLRNSKRTSPVFNHLSAISESIGALGWVAVEPTPAPYIKEMIDSSQFYTNRVLKDYKEKDPKHVEWAKSWIALLTGLQTFVRKQHTTGLVWNSSPGASVAGSLSSAGKAPAPPPPGPPPPPPPSSLFDSSNLVSGDSSADQRAALFAEINKGLDVTKGLKKVTGDMQTHKNPTLRSQQPVLSGKPAIAPKPGHISNGAPASVSATVAAPVLELQGGKKWIVENHRNNNNIVVEATAMQQVVYIYKCTDSLIKVKGKLNSITMDSCKKTSLVFDALVSSAEVINCQRAQVQTLGAMPTLQIQKTDGCQVYLSKESLDTEIVTSKSSEMNILVPDATGDFSEHPVHEQFKTVWDGSKLVTTPADVV